MTIRPNGFGQSTVSGIVTAVTDAAVLLQPDDGAEFWVPRKVCLDGWKIDEADEDINVADWWLREEGKLP